MIRTPLKDFKSRMEAKFEELESAMTLKLEQLNLTMNNAIKDGGSAESNVIESAFNLQF